MSRMLRKWNPKKHVYEPYQIPDSWNIPLISNDMEEVINCAQCGKEISFGEGYTSKQVQTGMGFGYYVCEACHEKEWQEEEAANETVDSDK